MNNYQKIGIDEVYKAINSDENGLSEEEASRRLAKYGKNVLSQGHKESVFQIFFSQLKSPIIYIMIGAAILSLAAKEYVDFTAILLIVFIDAVFGTVQEFSASKEAESLQKLIEVKTKVKRNGKEKVVNAVNITLGDVILLESGDKVPADARIITSMNLSVDESILTGESLPREKNSEVSESDNIQDTDNMLYGGTSVVIGRCLAIVVATGVHTEIGKISRKVTETKAEKSPLTMRIEKLTRSFKGIVS